MAKSLDRKLKEEAFRFEFFQAVRLIHRIFRDRRPVGSDAMPADEAVRFRSRIALDFPASEIHQIRETESADGQKGLEVTQNFMGLVGVSGVLPTHYTELTLDRIRHQDTTLWSFLDIFTHRAVSLFFRAWAKYRFPVSYETGDDKFTGYLFDLAGLGPVKMRGRMDVDDEALLPFTGLISQRPHSAVALENIVSDHFHIPAKVDQFTGQWLKLEKNDLTGLGSQHSMLGRDTVIGTRVWDQQSRFRIRLGPLPLAKFESFLPGGTANKALGSIVKFFGGLESDHDVQLVLEAGQVPGTVMTTRAARKPRLGWTSFLKTRPFIADDEQVVLEGAK